LLMNLILFSRAESFGVETGHAVRICLASAGVWWGIFTVVPLRAIKRRQPVKHLPPGESVLTVGFNQLRGTFRRFRRHPHTLTFLLAYLIYNDGIQTVITLSTAFGQEELGLSLSTLTSVILMVQFVAAFGAILFNYVAVLFGYKRAIVASLLIWTITLVYAYGFLKTTAEFFVLAAVIAVVLGGSQALSRSLFSLMVPRGQEAEYFSLYEVSERGTSWLGPLLFGLSLQITGSYRAALLSLVVFFILGLVLLFFVDVRTAVREAASADHAS